MLLLLDNYDSFTGNLLDAFRQLGQDPILRQNDRVQPQDLSRLGVEAVVLGPGPRRPQKAGGLMALLDAALEIGPVLGVCLGHQAIGQRFGASLVRGKEPVHGKDTDVWHEGDPLFEGLPRPFKAMRYHSLVLSSLEGTPLKAIGRSADGVLMAMRHTEMPVVGVQFHPESIGTPEGLRLLANWCREAGLTPKADAMRNGYF
jgi:anthranilate synthase/aminodeoxychorismate synthase-like glutamine amidotransferase